MAVLSSYLQIQQQLGDTFLGKWHCDQWNNTFRYYHSCSENLQHFSAYKSQTSFQL